MDSYATKINTGSSAFSMMLQAVNYVYGKNFEVIVYSGNIDKTKKLIKELRSIYQPNMVIMVFDDKNKKEISKLIPYLKLLPESKLENHIYICQNYSCKLPTNDLDKVKSFLLE